MSNPGGEQPPGHKALLQLKTGGFTALGADVEGLRPAQASISGL